MGHSEESTSDHVDVLQGQIRFGDEVHWWHQPNLRRLYLMMPFLFLGSTTLGYDGSLVNGLQTMPAWQNCEFSYHVSCSLTDHNSFSQPHWW